jgi:hypothetical protein
MLILHGAIALYPALSPILDSKNGRASAYIVMRRNLSTREVRNAVRCDTNVQSAGLIGRLLAALVANAHEFERVGYDGPM